MLLLKCISIFYSFFYINFQQQEQVEVKEVEKEMPAPSEVVIPPPPTSKTYVPPLLRNRPPGSSSDTPLRYNRYGVKKIC